MPFTEKERRAKQKATADLRRSTTTPVLVFSAASAVRREGRRRESHLLEEVGSPRRGSALVARVTATREPHAIYTTDEVLALVVGLYVHTYLTTMQYNSMRLSSLDC